VRYGQPGASASRGVGVNSLHTSVLDLRRGWGTGYHTVYTGSKRAFRFRLDVEFSRRVLFLGESSFKSY